MMFSQPHMSFRRGEGLDEIYILSGEYSGVYQELYVLINNVICVYLLHLLSFKSIFFFSLNEAMDIKKIHSVSKMFFSLCSSSSSHRFTTPPLPFSINTSVQSQTVCCGEQQLHVQGAVQHDPLRQRVIHGENPQQDVGALPAEEVQQVREVHHVSTAALDVGWGRGHASKVVHMHWGWGIFSGKEHLALVFCFK